MEELPDNNGEMDSFFNEEKFVIDTCYQINKDLAGLAENAPVFDLNLENDVMGQVVDQLSICLKSMSASNLQQFIYRVDLKETDFHRALSQEDDCQHLAYLVLRREAQKVYLRRKFS